jgi:phospholipase/lecithinase/hemolysin
MKRTLTLFWLLVCCSLTFSASAFDAIVAFGDSLTDTGNEPSEPYLHYEGRWSNGPLWIEQLSVTLGFPYNASNNLAHSGAQTDDTYNQVVIYTPTNDVSNTLFVVWAGGNDFLQEYKTYWFDDAGWAQFTSYSANNLSNAVVNLRSKGARYILVPNTVDVTTIPLLNRLPSFVRSYLQSKVKMFNNKLSRALTALQAKYPDITIYKADIYIGEKTLLKTYKANGFKKKSPDALSDPKLLDKSFDGPGAKYVFWDPIHPSSKAHGYIANYFYTALGSPQPAN